MMAMAVINICIGTFTIITSVVNGDHGSWLQAIFGVGVLIIGTLYSIADVIREEIQKIGK